MEWLNHFISHTSCGPDQPWRILLIDGARYHEAPEFIIKAKINHIWIVKFLLSSHGKLIVTGRTMGLRR